MNDQPDEDSQETRRKSCVHQAGSLDPVPKGWNDVETISLEAALLHFLSLLPSVSLYHCL